ncbi:hypothetical protein AMTR_s00062p00174230 [Amborella trichopoda]|uniref:Uncharacterized protein n=1 Tax=Amborella trichopoda TaxID=13333 RepID=U5DAX3_AMBTC|nr:hypothetical protein AMTR_s00062p00174230 [Amborella trichopoda]
MCALAVDQALWHCVHSRSGTLWSHNALALCKCSPIVEHFGIAALQHCVSAVRHWNALESYGSGNIGLSTLALCKCAPTVEHSGVTVLWHCVSAFRQWSTLESQRFDCSEACNSYVRAVRKPVVIIINDHRSASLATRLRRLHPTILGWILEVPLRLQYKVDVIFSFNHASLFYATVSMCSIFGCLAA